MNQYCKYIKMHSPEFQNLDPLVKHLCYMEPSIKLYNIFGSIENNKGFFITKNNIFIPFNLPDIGHEIAHLIEMNNCKRWVMDDWGIKQFCMNKTITAAAFFAALSRETRVRAIQMHMQPEFIGNNTSARYNILANSYWENLAKSFLPYGRFQSMQDVESWIMDLRERTYKKWCADRIISEFKIRLDYIRNYMESSSANT